MRVVVIAAALSLLACAPEPSPPPAGDLQADLNRAHAASIASTAGARSRQLSAPVPAPAASPQPVDDSTGPDAIAEEWSRSVSNPDNAVTTTQLLRTFERNVFAAEARYGDSVFHIKAAIGRIGKDASGRPLLVLTPGRAGHYVGALMIPPETSTVRELRPGELVRLICLGARDIGLGIVGARDCSIDARLKSID